DEWLADREVVAAWLALFFYFVVMGRCPGFRGARGLLCPGFRGARGFGLCPGFRGASYPLCPGFRGARVRAGLRLRPGFRGATGGRAGVADSVGQAVEGRPTARPGLKDLE